MKQYEAVIEVMRANQGYATLGYLYQEVPKVPNVRWGTKTPFASIRRIVQDERFFFKIRPGLWALNEYRDKVPFADQVDEKAPQQQKAEFDHSYYQGLMVEIGRLKHLDTFVPSQDRRKCFLNKPLSGLVTVHAMFNFSYENLVQCAQTVDVVWFNERRMPNAFIEVEHTTDMYRSLQKYVELQDFYASFLIVAARVRRQEYESKLDMSAFRPIKPRVRFLSYEDSVDLYTSLCKVVAIEQGW